MTFRRDLIYCKVGNFIEMLYVFGSNECLNSLFVFLILPCPVALVKRYMLTLVILRSSHRLLSEGHHGDAGCSDVRNVCSPCAIQDGKEMDGSRAST